MSHAKLGITKDLLATKVLPFLIPISIDSSLNLSQVNFLSSYVESDVIYYFKKNNFENFFSLINLHDCIFLKDFF